MANTGSLFDGDYVLGLFAAFEYDVDSDLLELYYDDLIVTPEPIAAGEPF